VIANGWSFKLIDEREWLSEVARGRMRFRRPMGCEAALAQPVERKVRPAKGRRMHETPGMTARLFQTALTVLAAWLVAGCVHLPPEGGVAARGAKRVEIDKTTQTLRAYDGDVLVLESRVSTGKAGKQTPNKIYYSGRKERMHISRRYDNAKMPFSVHLGGHYFIHGYQSVPNRPASHGCIRLPLDGENPARQFYEWIEPGTPVVIFGRWVG
jgi:lipoprotein-anchoring transpeptidase ErfK/SrfK